MQTLVERFVLAHCQTHCWALQQLRAFCHINVYLFTNVFCTHVHFGTVSIIIIIIIIIIIEFLTSQLWLGNIHLSWDAAINRIRLGGLTCSLKSFLQLNMCQELQIFAAVYMYWGAS